MMMTNEEVEDADGMRFWVRGEGLRRQGGFGEVDSGMGPMAVVGLKLCRLQGWGRCFHGAYRTRYVI